MSVAVGAPACMSWVRLCHLCVCVGLSHVYGELGEVGVGREEQDDVVEWNGADEVQ